MKVYIDDDFKCHITNDGTMTAVEDAFFDGKCNTFIEGYRFIPVGQIWIRPDGTECQGISPWKDYDELDAAQRDYERALIQDMQNALNKLWVTLDE